MVLLTKVSVTDHSVYCHILFKDVICLETGGGGIGSVNEVAPFVSTEANVCMLTLNKTSVKT